ncbi:CC0125/CC1285 family lipoprotein [Bradyrhizobium sp. 930_D9_N1_4]|uniref:CC0125/CC1285 family lipoprotein n=1 Tax=Bradyrhizobium sp. 930_D9_N1_4 TaxID=3240374 RepID=UPI003F8C4422
MLAAAAVMLTSCATPYQQSGLIGGAEVRELRPDVYRVTFQGNGYTTRETVQVYWLNRCAELAVEKGFAGFEILSDVRFVMRRPPTEDRHDARLASAIPSLKTQIPVSRDEASAFRFRPDSADPANRPLAPVRLARGGTLFVYSAPVAAGPKPGIEADIHFLAAPVNAAPPSVFNARTLLAQLEPIIKAEKCGVGNVCPHVHDYLLPKDMLKPQQGIGGGAPSLR